VTCTTKTSNLHDLASSRHCLQLPHTHTLLPTLAILPFPKHPTPPTTTLKQLQHAPLLQTSCDVSPHGNRMCTAATTSTQLPNHQQPFQGHTPAPRTEAATSSQYGTAGWTQHQPAAVNTSHATHNYHQTNSNIHFGCRPPVMDVPITTPLCTTPRHIHNSQRPAQGHTPAPRADSYSRSRYAAICWPQDQPAVVISPVVHNSSQFAQPSPDNRRRQAQKQGRGGAKQRHKTGSAAGAPCGSCVHVVVGTGCT
jgi:hypothetical protein